MLQNTPVLSGLDMNNSCVFNNSSTISKLKYFKFGMFKICIALKDINTYLLV